jgi:hypothetical protein
MKNRTTIKHEENEYICYLDSDHSGQKHNRDSQASWFCVPAFAKFQKVEAFKDCLNTTEIMLKVGELLKIPLVESDFNRAKEALKVVVAVADTTKENEIIVNKVTEWINKKKIEKPSVTLRELYSILTQPNAKNETFANKDNIKAITEAFSIAKKNEELLKKQSFEIPEFL